MRVGSEMYWAVVAPGATMLRRMWLLGVLLLALGIGAPIALVVWIVVERDELVDLALDDRFLRAIALTLAVRAVRPSRRGDRGGDRPQA